MPCRMSKYRKSPSLETARTVLDVHAPFPVVCGKVAPLIMLALQVHASLSGALLLASVRDGAASPRSDG